jgi:hypothetical protein
MRPIKALLTVAIAAALLAVPAGVLARHGRHDRVDRDHDRMADKWERRHHLNTHVNDARRDPDHDGRSNLSEFRHHTDPQKANDDDNEISGTIVSFQNNVLSIQPATQGAGTVSGTVNAQTRIECDDDNDDDAPASQPAATMSRDGGSDDGSGDNSGPGSDNSGPGSGGESGDDEAQNNQGGDDQGENDDDQGDDENACTSADLKPNQHVDEAKFVKAADGTTVFTKIELG